MYLSFSETFAGFFSYFVIYFWICGFLPYDFDKVALIKPSQNIYIIVIRNMTISIFVSIILWNFTPDISSLIFDNYILRFCLCILTTDILFYLVHKLLHCRQFYKYHKQHHEFYVTKPAITLYCGMVEHILCNTMTTILLPAMMRMSVYEFQIWMIFMCIHTCLLHSNYDYGKTHIIHHKKLVNNYGIFCIADILFSIF